MTLEIAFLFLLLAAMVYLFLTEKLAVDLTAFLGLSILILAGYLKPEEAFSGFASSAVITMLAIFIVSGALLQTGVADIVGDWVHRTVGGREVPLILTIMLVAGVLSAFMNNIAAAAVMMPAIASIARSARISPSRLFMPLSFGAILGGTTTLVGTPPNILAAAMLEERGLEPFDLFAFTPLGLVLLAVGMVYMATIGRKLLPSRELDQPLADQKDLAHVYQLSEQMFSIRIPHDSRLHGTTLGEARLGPVLGIHVVAILRDGKRKLAPGARTSLRGGDVLIVNGRLHQLQELFRVQSVEVQKTALSEIPRGRETISGISLRVTADSNAIGRTLRDLQFRQSHDVVVVAIQRDDEIVRERLADVRLQEGDRLLALGTRGQGELLKASSEFEVGEMALSAVRQLQAQLFMIRIPKRSSLVGCSLRDSRIGELAGITVGGIIRNGETRLAIAPDEIIQAQDRLVVTGEPSRILDLLKMGHVDLEANGTDPVLESDSVGVVEAAIAPRSSCAGRTIRELDFRKRYGLQVISVWHEGEPLHEDLADHTVQFGEALLLHGTWENIRKLAEDPDFVVLSQNAQSARRTRKAPHALAGLLLMVGLVVSGWQPIHVAAFTAASLVVLSGALSMREAYTLIEWRAIFLVAAILPVGIAMERTGAALLLSTGVTEIAGPFGVYAILGSLVVLSSLLSQGLDGAPAVVLLTPVIMQAAEQLGLSPYPIMMGVALAASAAFMTPFSHKANLLVMGAGGYKSMDYVRVGTPLTIIILILLIVLVPVFFPLN